MAKRFSDGEIWSKDWFLDLPIKQKLLLKFLFDNCDCAGIYEISYRTLKNCFGEEITKEDFKGLKQVVFINENTIYIQDFINFQYGCSVSDLNPNYSVHKGIIKKLNKYGIFETLSKGLDNSYNGELQDKDKDKDKEKDIVINSITVDKPFENTLYLVEKEKEKQSKEKESLQDWRGEYSNVHLNKAQYGKLLVLIGKKEKLNELIEQLSENIACKRANAPPYDESFPDMHFVILKKYWDFQRLKCDKQRTSEESQNDFKAQIKALAEKCRQEEREDLRSG